MQIGDYQIELRAQPEQAGSWFCCAIATPAAETAAARKATRALVPGRGSTRSAAEAAALDGARSWVQRQPCSA